MLIVRNGLLFFAVLVLGATLFVGCSGQAGRESDNQQAENWQEGLDENVVNSLSQLSAAERTAALKQEKCPVTDMPLGSMGKPPKVTVEGTDVYLCCAGCKEDLTAEPGKYLAKLKQ